MTSPAIRVTILGSGTSSGVPVPGCDCDVCLSPDPRNNRTRCSLLVCVDAHNILIDTATDLRQQALRERITRIDAVLFTHTHADHVNGIDDLRPFSSPEEAAIPIFGSAESLTNLRRSFRYIFEDEMEPGYRPRLAPREITGPFMLFGQTVIPLPLQHGRGRSLGYRIGDLAYLTDCSAIPEETMRQLDGLDLLILDALRFRPHATHFNIPQALEAAARIGARRTLLTHLSHDVEHSRDNAQLPSGVELAYDGQQLTVAVTPAQPAKLASAGK